MTPKLLKHAKKLLKDWEKRKVWGNGYTGPYTTEEEDRLARCLFLIVLEDEKQK